MSKRKVYLGPYNNHIKERLHDLTLEYLNSNKGDRFFYLLPNRELLNHYRNEFIDKLDATFDLNFITFDDIVTKIMDNKVTNIANDPIKRIIMRKVLKDLNHRSMLRYYKDFTEYNGFVESCIYIIGSIKRSLITPKEYLSNCGNSPHYREIGLIYEEYERSLKEKEFFDKDSLYLESIDLLKSNKGFLDSLDFIIIDEFYDFRPIELEILNLLKDLDIDIYINIPYKIKNKNIRLEETISALVNLGFEIEDVSKDKYTEFEQLGNILFDSNDSKVEANVELIKSSSLYLEIKNILKEIKNNYHYNAIDLKDNCICVFNKEYSNMIYKVAKEEKLPLSMDKTVYLKNLPLTKEIITMIEFNLFAGEKEILLNRLKSAYLPVCEAGLRDRLEYVLRTSKFDDINDLYNNLTNGKIMDIPENHSEDIIETIKVLKEEILVLKESSTLKEFNEKLLSILDGYDLEKNILQRYERNKNFDILQRDLSNYTKIRDILKNMEATLFLEEEISLNEYLIILLDYFEEEDIIDFKGNPNGIKIVTIDNARGIEYRKVFIAGLTQNTYPNLINNNFFFSDDNYIKLRNIGVDVKSYKNRMDNEILKFVSLISSCKEKLYISCNLDAQGSENPLYSIFLDEVLHKLIGNMEEEKVNVTNIGLEILYDNDIKYITNEREFSFKIFNDYYNGQIDLAQLQYHNYLYSDKIDRIKAQFESNVMREAKEFNEYSGLLNQDFPKEYISNELKNRKFSVSFLESYSICPYSFLLNNIFNIEQLERETQDYNPMDNGTIYHEVLRVYYEKYKDELNDIEEFNISNTFAFLKESLFSEACKLGYDTVSKNKLLLIEDMYNKLKSYIEDDIERLKKHSDIRPWKFEEWFNMDYQIDGNKIEIRGIIDRIDRTNDDKYIIIDYKSSTYGKKTIKDIENKISLQLPIYIMSQKDKNVVGGFYGVINTPGFHNCMGLLGETKLVNSRQDGAMDIDKWNNIMSNTELTIENIVKQISKGNFSVNPRECSPYCIYKDICRYDKVQEVE